MGKKAKGKEDQNKRKEMDRETDYIIRELASNYPYTAATNDDKCTKI
jgi:hypothetical protein